MVDTYNIAIKYLKDTYGYKRNGYTASFFNKLRKARNKQEHKEIEATATERDFNITINPVTKESDKEIELLVKQYYYGNDAKKELFNILLRKNLVNLK